VAVLRVLALPGLKLVALSEGLAQQAARRASRHFLKGADAIYVALAASSKAPLVTLDDEMLERGAEAVKTLTPAD
jgi:predicted nucleic acid-binding protein